jgi:P-type Ca2+ transporter type 2C
MYPYWAKKEDEVFKELKTTKEGLSQNEAKKRLEKFGKNRIEKKRKFNALKILWDQLNSPLIYILLFAGVVSFLLESKLDAYVIGLIILINTGIGFFQQYRAENAINNLKKFIIPKAKVNRDGKLRVIDSSLLVPGDIVFLETGEKVSADLRIIKSENLDVNEAVLTGESTSVLKSSTVLKEKIAISEKKNMLFAGTQIVGGFAQAVVVSTGSKTEFGNIASKLQDIQTQKTPMQKRIEKFSKQIGLIIIGLVILVFVLGIISGENYLDMFMVAITLAVGAIPEGLPAVMAIAFSISSALMAKKNVIIRRLPAVESLGSVTVICTDKTGTITEEKMVVQKIYSNNKIFEKRHTELYLNKKKINPEKEKELALLMRTSILSSNARFEKKKGGYEFIGDPTETSLISNGLDLGFSKKILTEDAPRLKTFDFDSNRKLMSILRRNTIHQTLFTKGAPEKVLKICASELVNGRIIKMTDKRRKQLRKEIQSMEEDALRILGFAYKNFTKTQKVEEKGLIFLGFIGMQDPPRKEVAEAIRLCKSAGIKVKMITGDSLITGRSVAKKVGIIGTAVDSIQLKKMSDEELLKNIDKIAIFTRATPEQKLRILKALQSQGETVAMTGDGVNDVLALKSADVGISMGIKGTDVARDVSDIILVDDNFASIVNGVKYGRTTYDNIKKFTKYMLSINFDTIILVTITALAGLPLPILPLQILWKNIITDSFPAMSLIFEKEDDVMNTPPRREKSPLEGTYKFMITAGLLNLAVCATVYFYTLLNGFDHTVITTSVMTTDILFELFFIYACRTHKPLKEVGIFSNKFLNWSIIIALGLQILLLYTELGTLFHTTPPTLIAWAYMIPLALSGVIIYEIGKLIHFKGKEKRKN